MSNSGKIIISVLVILFIVGLLFVIPYLLYRIVDQTTSKIIAPFEQSNNQIKTQVSQILHPTPTIIPDPVTIIHEVRSLSRLETIQYSVEKVITAETGQGEFSFLFGDKLLLVAHGTVIAGVDLAKLTVDDMRLRGSVLEIKLPPAEIFVATLNNDQSYVYDRTTGLLNKGDLSLETQARQVAEDEIEKSALEDGILDQAQVNAENYLSRLLRNLGYQDVIFK